MTQLRFVGSPSNFQHRTGSTENRTIRSAMAEIAVDNANQIEERWHPSLYFADGDIVVSAVSKDKSYIEFYRVDRVFLARHSTIFKDMFVVGESNLDMEQYDGVPKVHLPDDAEDVAGLLSAIYDVRTLPLSREPCSDTPLKVQGIMRLAVKYEVETIRGTILKHVESEWPQTLEEWERRCNEREGKRTIVSDPAFEKEEENYPDPALAVRFGLEFNCPKILPAAFYDLATARGPRPQLGTWGPPISWECLRAADLLGLIAGQKALAIMSMEITTIKWGCPCEQCSQIVQACLSRVLDQGNILNPLVVLRSFGDQLSSRRRTDFCNPAIPCLVIPDETKSMAEVLWRELPLMFNLSNMNDGFE